ncbi:hypothetical protein FGB62_14g116 [Gracilaria domingensis]|nr:hypothetical protein FGB62_14g116 [Gracilaria domingensis]
MELVAKLGLVHKAGARLNGVGVVLELRRKAAGGGGLASVKAAHRAEIEAPLGVDGIESEDIGLGVPVVIKGELENDGTRLGDAERGAHVGNGDVKGIDWLGRLIVRDDLHAHLLLVLGARIGNGGKRRDGRGWLGSLRHGGEGRQRDRDAGGGREARARRAHEKSAGSRRNGGAARAFRWDAANRMYGHLWRMYVCAVAWRARAPPATVDRVSCLRARAPPPRPARPGAAAVPPPVTPNHLITPVGFGLNRERFRSANTSALYDVESTT